MMDKQNDLHPSYYVSEVKPDDPPPSSCGALMVPTGLNFMCENTTELSKGDERCSCGQPADHVKRETEGRNEMSEGLCSTHTGGPHPEERACKNWKRGEAPATCPAFGKRKVVCEMKLPRTVFVKFVIDRDNAPWLDANADIEALAEKGEVVTVGEYKLVKTGKVSLNLLVK